MNHLDDALDEVLAVAVDVVTAYFVCGGSQSLLREHGFSKRIKVGRFRILPGRSEASDFTWNTDE